MAIEKQPEPRVKSRNPETHQAHRRDVLWQITLPLIVGVLLFIGLAVAASWGSMGSVRAWADTGIVWLIFLMFLPGILLLLVLVGLVYGITWLITNIPDYALQVQNVFTMISNQVKKVADKVVEPVMRVEGTRASVKSIFRK